jgi:uncharacterized cupin superfamily protein
VNVLSFKLGESLEREGFRHAAASVGDRIGAARIGAGIYEAEAGWPIWPYHYHHGVEEWLHVLSGAPVVREGVGERILAPGDFVCFRSGHLGAHTVRGPGRFVIFSTGGWPAPSVSVYPDSDKVGVSPGDSAVRGLNALMLPRAAAVDYWHGEGSGGPLDPVQVVREPTAAPSPPVVNALAVPVGALFTDVPAGFRSRAAMLGPALGAERLGATVLELDPGEGSAPYHYEYGREEWVLVLAGTPTLRHPAGEDELEAGDLVCFPEGPAGAHRLVNHGDRVVRLVFFSTKGLPANVCYPDSGKWFMRNGPDGDGLMLREAEAVGYWDGEV